ncbi:hypothetical protein BDP81DRAFT_494495 [Colletotrichum phormii]|uniref:Uncharacterized protein n=1 Tax=Colletotrichum phormii TaxID=359342 RepID=A0AAJ0EEF8_9PEZI|nr:uncharacterized protein BDP81DRAFT_494495 [Colletotrichum phormii]KAK1634046.1 hypothetical protein BDP81DRAFT_494495 [Colletotrichum phormii]
MGTGSTLLRLAVLLSLVVALEAVRFHAGSSANTVRQAATSSGQYCGYEDNEKHEPWDCHSETCVTRGSIMGCGSSPITSCLEYDDPICSQKLEGPGTVCCTDITSPFCATGVKYITRDSIFTLKAFNCGNNQFSGPITPVDYLVNHTCQHFFLRVKHGDLVFNPQTEKAVPIGAIVGGAITGLVVMGLIVAAVVWMILRNRKKAIIGDENQGGAVSTDPIYTYEAVPPRGATSEWKSSTPAPVYEPHKSNHQSAKSGAYQYQSQTPSQSPGPTSRSGALPNDYSSNRISEVPATNPAGTGDNASELHSDYIQRS